MPETMRFENSICGSGRAPAAFAAPSQPGQFGQPRPGRGQPHGRARRRRSRASISAFASAMPRNAPRRDRERAHARQRRLHRSHCSGGLLAPAASPREEAAAGSRRSGEEALRAVRSAHAAFLQRESERERRGPPLSRRVVQRIESDECRSCVRVRELGSERHRAPVRDSSGRLGRPRNRRRGSMTCARADQRGGHGDDRQHEPTPADQHCEPGCHSLHLLSGLRT